MRILRLTTTVRKPKIYTRNPGMTLTEQLLYRDGSEVIRSRTMLTREEYEHELNFGFVIVRWNTEYDRNKVLEDRLATDEEIEVK